MMCQYGFIDCDKCITLVQDFDIREAACMWTQRIHGDTLYLLLSFASTQFCCEWTQRIYEDTLYLLLSFAALKIICFLKIQIEMFTSVIVSWANVSLLLRDGVPSSVPGGSAHLPGLK